MAGRRGARVGRGGREVVSLQRQSQRLSDEPVLRHHAHADGGRRAGCRAVPADRLGADDDPGARGRHGQQAVSDHCPPPEEAAARARPRSRRAPKRGTSSRRDGSADTRSCPAGSRRDRQPCRRRRPGTTRVRRSRTCPHRAGRRPAATMASTGSAMLMSAMGSSLSGSRKSSVSMMAGLTTCTLTPVSARSIAIHSDHAVSAAFDAEYAASVPRPQACRDGGDVDDPAAPLDQRRAGVPVSGGRGRGS